MLKLLIATALTAVVFVANANANAQNSEYRSSTVLQEVSLTVPFQEKTGTQPTIRIGSTIGIARLDKGRLIYAPMAELRDWADLDSRSGATSAPVSPAALIKNLPNVPMNGRDSDNKLDEIRLTASDLRMDYVLIYGMGSDAQWGSFAGKAMAETGFIFQENEISPRAAAKAVLVNTYTGQVYGTATSDKIQFNISDLANEVGILINALTTEILRKTA